MKKFFNFSIIAFILTITTGIFLNYANAEDVEYTVSAYLVRVDFIPIPDVEKHSIGLYERRGVAIFNNGETAAYHSRGTWDHIDENGTWQGYSTLTFKDGSTIIAKGSGNISKEYGKYSTLTGKSEYIKGTGKYEGIKGNLSFSGNSITPYNDETKGDAIMNAKGSYTLPK